RPPRVHLRERIGLREQSARDRPDRRGRGLAGEDARSGGDGHGQETKRSRRTAQAPLTTVVYFRRVGSEDIHSRVAVNSEQIRHLANELGRTRERLHELESDRATLRVVVTQVRELTEQMPNLARRAAREAVDEMLRRRHADTLGNWRTYAALLSAGVALGALIVALVLR